MNLPDAAPAYTRAWMQSVLRILRLADTENHKKNRDVEIGEGRLILTSNNGRRWSITVSDTGVLNAPVEVL